MHVRYPVGLATVPAPGAGTFALLFAVESLARSLLATVISLQALAMLGDARDVSLLFTTVGVTGLVASLFLPRLVDLVGRRWVFTAGCVALVAAAAAFATLSLPGQAAGMWLRVLGAAALSITSSLYILQYIRRNDLTLSEPRRLQASAAAWTLGPAAGVWIYHHAGPAWTYGLSAATALALLACFWVLRLSDAGPIVAADTPPPDPVRNVRRFFAQPRLRLAWSIALGRSSWWVFFFIYTPIYMVQSGHAPLAGALLVSAGNAMLFVTPLFGRLALFCGIRRVLRGAFLACALATALCALVYDSPVLVAGLLLVAALGCVALDALGNIPFLRSVRVYERSRMTSVFRTYIDVSEIAVPAAFALLLSFFDLRSLFVAAGAAMLLFAHVSGYLPGRMGVRVRRPARIPSVVAAAAPVAPGAPAAAADGPEPAR